MKITPATYTNFCAKIPTRDFIGLLCEMPTVEKPGDLYEKCITTLTNGKLPVKNIQINTLFKNINNIKTRVMNRYPDLYLASKEVDAVAEDAIIKSSNAVKYYAKVNAKLAEIEEKFGKELDIKDFE